MSLKMSIIETASQPVVEIVSPYLESSHEVIVDCDQSFDQMIAAGKYGGTINGNITAENFPIKGMGRKLVTVDLLHFNECFSKADMVIMKLKETNNWLFAQGADYRYGFAGPEELLTLGATRPNLQRKFPIAGLGRSWFDAFYRRFLYLSSHGFSRRLRLGILGNGFGRHWRFAVVRKKPIYRLPIV